MLHLQTNILMDRGWLTWLNFWQGYTVSDASRYTSVEETGLWTHRNEFNSVVCRNVSAYIAEKTVTVMARGNMNVCNRKSLHADVFSLMRKCTTCLMFRRAKCRTHLLVITPNSSPEMAFLCIPWILLHQGAGWTLAKTIPLLSKQTDATPHKWSITSTRQPMDTQEVRDYLWGRAFKLPAKEQSHSCNLKWDYEAWRTVFGLEVKNRLVCFPVLKS